MTPSYKANDPRGWCGDPKRGAALGRPTVHEAPSDAPIKLYLRRVRLNQGGYDPNGTYFGWGERLYWYASEDGEVDGMIRATDRGAAIEKIRKLHYPHATFFGESRGS